MLTRSAIALAALVLMTAGPSYAQPLRSTSIPSRLADDEKRLLPEVMNEFYGAFDEEKQPFSYDKEEKGCWISKKFGPPPQPGPYMWGVDTENTVNEDITYCMVPIRLDVTKSAGRKTLFVVAGGNYLDEDGQPQGADPIPGVLGLIVLTPNGANLGVVGTNGLYEGYESYGGYPQHVESYPVPTICIQSYFPSWRPLHRNRDLVGGVRRRDAFLCSTDRVVDVSRRTDRIV
jgi:hypothetical protein